MRRRRAGTVPQRPAPAPPGPPESGLPRPARRRRSTRRRRLPALVAAVAAVALVAGPGAGPAAAEPHCPRGVVALTFDDGPGPHTPAILDVLAEHDVPATFFVIGRLVGGRAAVVQRAARDGHAIANHTFDHEQLTSRANAEIRATVRATDEAIRAAGADPVKLVRPPYGATNGRVREVLGDAGYGHVLWTVDPQDWRGHPSGVLATHVVNRLAPNANILFHDGSPHAPNTAAALPRIIRTAREQGFCFGVLDARGRVVAPEQPAPPPVQVAPPQEVEELAGPDRIATAVAMSAEGWPDGAREAVVVNGWGFHDGLVASVLAGKIDGPLLLSGPDQLAEATAEELRRLDVEHVYLVGALGRRVELTLQARRVGVTTLQGEDRFETALLVAAEVAEGESETVYVVSGEVFADGLAAGVLAARDAAPILFNPPEPDGQLYFWARRLGADRTIVIGGASAVPDEALAGLPDVARIAGENRAATAAAVADRAVAAGAGRAPLLTSSVSFADGLAGGALGARIDAPLLVTGPDRLAPEVHTWLEQYGTSRVTVLGGPAAVGPGPRCQLETGYDRPDVCD